MSESATEKNGSLRITIPKTSETTLAQTLFLLIMVHYLWWWIPLTIGLIFVLRAGGWLFVLAAALLYLPWFFNGAHLNKGYPWPAFRQWSWWKLAQEYGGVDVLRTTELDPSKKYIFGFHPHGILILSRVATYGGVWEKLFPGIETRVLGATPMFWIVGSREICLWLGAIDAARKSAVRAIKAGYSLIVYPGGSKEIFLTDPLSTDVTIVLRKGFVKLALEHGCNLVPVVVFGERHCFHKLLIDKATKDWFLRVLKVPLLLFWGRYFSWMPLDKPLGVVFGAPIPVQKTENMTDSQVDELYKQYSEAVKKLWYDHRASFPFAANDNLIITEA